MGFLIKRAVANGTSGRRVAEMAFYFYATAAFEGVHPLQGGLLRRKSRRQRRSGLPRETVLAFAARRLREVVATNVPMLRLLWKIDRLRRRIQRDALSHTGGLARLPLAVATH